MSVEEGAGQVFWRRPIALLILMAAAQPLAFSVWHALLNNFVIERAQFTGVEIGWLQTVREIPGFLAVGVIALVVLVREQVLGLVMLATLGAAVALTAQFPSFGGLLATTLIGSIGFHYFEAINQSLQLQWIEKARAPQMISWMIAVGSAAALFAYGALVIGWSLFDLNYNFVYFIAGGATLGLALFALFAFPQYEGKSRQNTRIVLRKRYWLYYLLQFMAGARRQIFVVFAGFMMVERFGFHVHEIAALLLINYMVNMVFAPVMGRAVARWGERRALMFEYTGLVFVFLAYGGIYLFDWGMWMAVALYVLDHLFFAMAFAQKTYFQKIADPADIRPTSAVAFTINHIAAVFLPAALGYLWLATPGGVFGLAALFAACSLGLAMLIPRYPEPGRETVFAPRTA
ncbi:MAG: MFS transporter [Paracoccaceae bacterium]